MIAYMYLTFVHGEGVCFMYIYKHGEGCGALNKRAKNVHKMSVFLMAPTFH